jgi:hypothetical protein
MDASKKFGRHLKEQKGAKHMRPSGTKYIHPPRPLIKLMLMRLAAYDGSVSNVA